MLKERKIMSYKQITSIDYDTLHGILSSSNIEAFMSFHQTILSHVFLRSALNQNPIPMWQSGAQAVAVNLQTSGTDLQTTNAMFATNGRCGYVLKPDQLMTGEETSCIITLKVLEGRHLRTLKPPNASFDSPHVQV